MGSESLQEVRDPLNLKRFFLVFAICLFFHIASYSAFGTYVSILFFVIGVLLLFFSFRAAFVFFVAVAYISVDVPYSLLETSFEPKTIFSVTILGITIMKLWCIAMISVISMKSLFMKHYIICNNMSVYLYLLFFSILFCLVNGNYIYITAVVGDIRLFVNFFIGFLGVVLAWRRRALPLLTIVVSGLFISVSQTIIMLFNAYLMSSRGAIYQLASDTNSYLIPFFILFCIVIVENKKYTFYGKFISVMSIAILSTSFIVSASRGRMLIALLALLLYFITFKKFKGLAVFLGLFTFVMVSIPLVNENMYSYLMWKMSTIVPSVENASSMTRYVEFYNIVMGNLESPWDFIWGKGLGAYWDSSYLAYPYDLLGRDAYPDMNIVNDQYFKPHGLWLFSLLKFGIVGTAIFYGYFVYLFCSAKVLVKRRNNMTNVTLQCLAIQLPILYVVAFSSKLQLIGGVISGVISLIVLNNRERQVPCSGHPVGHRLLK